MTRWSDAVIKGLHLLQQAHRLQIEHTPGLRLRAGPHRITGEAKNITNSQRVSPQQVPLERNPVAVPAAQLQHRLEPTLLEQAAQGQAAHAHHSPTAIGDIEGLDSSPQAFSCSQGPAGVSPQRRCDLHGDHRLPAGQCLL